MTTAHTALRPASEEDSPLFLCWRNADHVRKFMRSPDMIPEESHIPWFKRAVTRDDARYFVYEPNGKPIGMVSFTGIADNSAEWGFYLGEAGLPKGTGTAMLRDGITVAFTELGLKEIRAHVLAHNVASMRLHEKLGFSVTGQDDDGMHVVLRK